jgi:hypothetical protein
MKILLGILFCVSSSLSIAACNVYVPKKEFFHDSGYSISFDFYAIFEAKGYREVDGVESADQILTFEGSDLPGRFRKAQAIIEMGEIRSEFKVTCLMQLCSIRDFAKSFQRAYQDFSQKVPHCSDSM